MLYNCYINSHDFYEFSFFSWFFPHVLCMFIIIPLKYSLSISQDEQMSMPFVVICFCFICK